MNAVQVLVFAAVFTIAYGLGYGTSTADLCSDPKRKFSGTLSVTPGDNVTIMCSVIATNVKWNSSQLTTDVVSDYIKNISTEELGGASTVFQFISVSGYPPCATSTATITNIQESLQGLDLGCFSSYDMESSSIVFNVIDPPDVVVFDTYQNCGNIVTNWIALPDDPCPITEYSISFSGISVSVSANQTNYTHLINDSDCGNTLEISVSAISVAGTGNITAKCLKIVCTPTNVSIVNVSDTNAVVQWTAMDVTGVVGYEVMSMSVEKSTKVSTSTFVFANVDMASVELNNCTIPVTFTVKSLLTGKETCYTSQTTLPALKKANQIATTSEASNVTFPFLHLVMTTSLSFSWSPSNGTCAGNVLGMDVIVNCFGLTNDVEYIVTVEVTLIVNGALLPVNFSESFTPTAPPLPSSTASATTGVAVTSAYTPTSAYIRTATATSSVGPTLPKGLSSEVIAGIVIAIVGIIILLVVVILIICALCVKKSESGQNSDHQPKNDINLQSKEETKTENS